MSSPNMNLPIPVPSQTGGPQYALDEVSCFTQIDSHNHTSSQGVQVPVDGLNIDKNLSFNSNSLTNLKSVKFSDQAITPGHSSLYMLNGNLWYTNLSGNDIQLTKAGSINITGQYGFTGLPSGTAGAAFLPGSSTFQFQAATNTAATMDIGPINLRNTTAGSNKIILTPPNPLPADYTITLPGTKPALGTTKILQMDSAGTILNTLDVDNSTLEINGTSLRVKALGIGTNELADNSVTLQKLNLTGSTYSEDLINTGSASLGSASPYTVMTNTVTTTQANQNLLINCWATGGGPLVTGGALWSYYGGLSADQGTGPYTDPSCGLRIYINGPGVVNYNVFSIAPLRQGSGAVYICYGHGSGEYLAAQAGVYTITAKIVTVLPAQ